MDMMAARQGPVPSLDGLRAVSILVVLGCLMIRDPWFRETLRYTLLGVGNAVLVSAVLFGSGYRHTHWILNTRLLRWSGRLSYSLYVWHEGVASCLLVHDLRRGRHP
ncbi:MAG TPA: hypothetical protein DDZ81_04190 [Acetobacteraceae bacterium]|nr:hypothetical protein [Acetobacteraceae bacterium]